MKWPSIPLDHSLFQQHGTFAMGKILDDVSGPYGHNTSSSLEIKSTVELSSTNVEVFDLTGMKEMSQD
ncbi:hypothetical protein PM082_009227 [Marasmius tenuissimus]|nr:hypothetical protein PM082_009227 [Marasmius tenuissimus]